MYPVVIVQRERSVEKTMGNNKEKLLAEVCLRASFIKYIIINVYVVVAKGGV